MGPGDENQTGASGSLRTRSHSRADPLWTTEDMLILVNEIAVVESECQNALSSYQKWSMIAENCTALDVVRNMNQCRRKWESLQAEFKLIKEWEAKSRNDSYWSLGSQERTKIGLPLDFNRELYEAMESLTKLQGQADTDPEDDPEATEIDVVDAEESGPKPKRVKRRSNTQKRVIRESKQHLVEEDPEKPVPTPQNKVVGESKQLVLEEELVKPVTHIQSIPQEMGTGKRKHALEEEFEKPDPAFQSNPLIRETKQPVFEEKLEKPVITSQSPPEEPVLEEEPEKPEEPVVKEMEEICTPTKLSYQLTPQKEVIGNKKKQPMPEEESEERTPVVEQRELVHEEPKAKRGRRRSNPNKLLSREKKQSRDLHVEEMERTLAEKVKENTELIHAILAGNLNETQENEMHDREDENTLKIERARSKADKLVSCLRDLAKNLEQLCDIEGC